MRPILFLIPFTLGVLPLQAQRESQEARVQSDQARQNRERVAASARELELRNAKTQTRTLIYLSASESVTERSYRLGEILFAVTARGVASNHIDPAGRAPRSIPQRTPGRLTLVSPDGGPNGTIAAEVSIADLKGKSVAAVTVQPRADSLGVYRIDLPSLRLGEYNMTVTTTSLDRPGAHPHVSVQRLVAHE
jgi:hypothetical protein